MPSDATGPLARLADLLAEAGGSGVRPTGRELAELLWLARRMEDAADEGAAAEAERPKPPVQPPVKPPSPEPTPPPAPAPEAPRPPSAPEARAPLHLPSPRTADAPSTAPRHASLLAPAPPMLRHPLGLQRALRPLKRRKDAPTGRELDERATAERIARLGAAPEWWLPVMRPARERWLRLRLVHDTGPTMPVWRPLVTELHTALAQSGVFRTVTVHRAAPDGTVGTDAAHTPADGRTVTLLLSDCMGPQWRKGPAATRWYATLRRWSHRMPVALVQPLPEHLWRDTALPTTPGRLSSPHPAAPSAALTFTPYDDTVEAGVPLPVLEPDPAWLANWASLTASPGGTRYPAAVAILPATPPDATGLTDLSLLTPEELVLRFRATASPEAFRLAGHLALGRPDLPVMRLIHAALEPDPRPQHLAEVILSGLLTSTGPTGSYTFRPGVPDLLLRAVPRTSRLHTTDLLERVGGLIDHRAGRARGEFVATTPAEGGTETAQDGEAFATVRQESLRRLTGSAWRDDAPGPAHTPALTLTTSPLSGRPEARIRLEYAVHDALVRGALTPQQYEVTVREDGYLVHTEPGTDLLPVLVAALRSLPDALAGLRDAPPVRVTFQDAPQPPVQPPLLVCVPPALQRRFAASSAALGPHRFRPLYGPVDAPPLAWYCPLVPGGTPPGEDRDLVRGPLIARDLRELRVPDTGRTAAVHAPPDRPLTLLNPVQPHEVGPHATTYYEVDLTPHEASRRLELPSSGKGGFPVAVELSWHVRDPVAFVHGGPDRVLPRLLDHLTDTASGITRRYSLRHAAGAERAVAAALAGDSPVPGLAVNWSVRLGPAGADTLPPATVPAPRPLSELLADAELVLLGFDGPLTRLFSAQTAREAVRDLLSLVTEHRDPAEALEGRPLPRPAPLEAFPHPLDVLRAFSRDRLGPRMAARLEELELLAVRHSPATHRSSALVDLLHTARRQVAVVTDVSEAAVHRYARHHRLHTRVHGRDDDLGRLMPDPGCLRRAVGEHHPAAPPRALLISSSVAEVTAARRIGVPCIGLGRNPMLEQHLLEAGCEVTVSSLEPVLEAARTL